MIAYWTLQISAFEGIPLVKSTFWYISVELMTSLLAKWAF